MAYVWAAPLDGNEILLGFMFTIPLLNNTSIDKLETVNSVSVMFTTINKQIYL